jgi:HD-like signal output (HDOD) protein
MKSIYIIDRNEDFLKKISDTLTLHGFIVKTFFKLSEFQQTFSYEKPDVIICNPVIEGLVEFALIKWIRDRDESIPVIVYVKNPSKETIVLAKKYNVSAILVYPFKDKELLLRLNKLLKVNVEIKTNISNVEKEQIIRKEKIKSEILIQLEKLPSFPAVIREIENLINSPESSARDFENVIRKDQVITAKVLKIVNSPFYSLRRKITTISESVAYIGYDALRSIVYSASVSNLLKGTYIAYGYKREILWRHSFTTAIISKILAQKTGLDDKLVEELFVSGLIHDIGKIILGFLGKRDNIFFTKDGNNGFIESERKHFLFSHSEVGGLIASKWRLPEIHKNNILKHHEPENKYNKIITLSDLLSNLMLKLIDNEDFVKGKFYELLEIDEKGFEELKKESEELYEKLDKEGIF